MPREVFEAEGWPGAVVDECLEVGRDRTIGSNAPLPGAVSGSNMKALTGSKIAHGKIEEEKENPLDGVGPL